MVSRGRLYPARHAVECFRRQTYAARELVVVIDDPRCDLVAHLLALGDPRIRLVQLDAADRTLGELRNLAVANARGEYVCQWDDDDLYAPRRIEVQQAALRETGSAACVLRRWTLWWPGARRLAISGARIWEGSILARRQDLPLYPGVRRGEDTEMMEALLARTRVVSLDAPELYLYVHHGGNSFGVAHFTSIYNHSRRRWTGKRYDDELGRLAATLPVGDYAAGLRQDALPDGAPSCRNGDADAPVAIVVRSMGRPELRAALQSLADQDYPAIEVIVVDATGGRHPPLPEIAWPPGHTVRVVAGDRPLSRPQAANAGLEAVNGRWFGFLDDDDTFDDDHVSDLMALAATTDALVVYGLSRLLDDNGETSAVVGLPFNRAIVFLAPLCSFPAALFRREVIDRGCRFDEALEIFEDQDFFRQVALHSGFARSGLATFNYHIEAGTSGTGRGGNRDWVRGPQFDQRLRAKWAGHGSYHLERVTSGIERAKRAFHDDHDPQRAGALLQSLLAVYPDEPNALNASGYLCLEAGETAAAEGFLRRAVDINPAAGEYRFNLARALDRAGRPAEARRELQVAASDPQNAAVREAARAVLAQLPRSPAGGTAAAGLRAGVARDEPSRLAGCPCGSGRRYKHCCGRQPAVPRESAADGEARRALDLFRAGEAGAAMTVLDRCALPEITVAASALACGNACRELQRYERALAFFRQAAAVGATLDASSAVTECCSSWFKPERDASMLRMANTLIGEINGRRGARTTRTDGTQPIHIVGAFDRIGGSEHRAFALHAALSPHLPTRLWSTVPPLPEYVARYPIESIDEAQRRFPTAGHLVFVGTYFEYGSWLERCRPSRVTICFNFGLPETLVARLVALQQLDPGFTLDLTYPSRRFAAVVGLPGRVEYALVDPVLFCPTRAPANGIGALRIGRHSRDDRVKFHPNDPSLFRRLRREGHQLEIVGGTCVGQALAPDVAAGGIALHPEGHPIVPFLDRLDCFVYRVHPEYFETGGTVVLEAMAMALPVIVFGERVGIAELIEHGCNGYVVKTEAQAIEHVGALQRDPALRQRIGAAARQTIVTTMQQQQRSVVDFYVGP